MLITEGAVTVACFLDYVGIFATNPVSIIIQVTSAIAAVTVGPRIVIISIFVLGAFNKERHVLVRRLLHLAMCACQFFFALETTQRW